MSKKIGLLERMRWVALRTFRLYSSLSGGTWAPSRSGEKVNRDSLKLVLTFLLCALLSGLASNTAAEAFAMEGNSPNGALAKNNDTLVIALEKRFPSVDFSQH